MGQAPLQHPDRFVDRHVGPSEGELQEMLETLGHPSLDAMVGAAIPRSIRMEGALELAPPLSEHELLGTARALAGRNRVTRAYLGMGYHGTVTPPVILRNVLENPGWYTQYTPYQAEISQGRLEALLNFQTMVIDLTGMEIANASLLDEATAAAEAMAMCYGATGREGKERFLVDARCHPQTVAVVRTRAEARGIQVEVVDALEAEIADDVFAVLVQYPDSEGRVQDYRSLAERVHGADALLVAAADLLALTLLAPPGEWGADVAVGSTQRFGVPMGFGGPHAAYLSTRDRFKRTIPGRIIGVSRDANGRAALRMALQTREQHIRREKATSNICTAQVLLAVIAGFYAVWHGPEGLTAIARRVHRMARILAEGLRRGGMTVPEAGFFDTLRVEADDPESVLRRAAEAGILLRRLDDGALGVALDETVSAADLDTLFRVFGVEASAEGLAGEIGEEGTALPAELRRRSAFMEHPVFHTHRSETEMMRYIKKLEGRDLSLTHSMIPLGSCTMKLNAAAEMLPITWEGFSSLHPFAPEAHTEGYRELFRQLEHDLAEITGFHAVSLQPNAGSQGEYAGLLVIRRYHEARGDTQRDVCLIPQSAHGTNPASAVMAGMRVVVVKSDADGSIDIEDLRARAEQHGERLSALMVTYPSTHGVFEEGIREICEIVHRAGGQVYMDGANMNAMVGLCRPGDFGADVCHLNLHKTFCIPHGGGGPGMGPIGVAEHLAPFLPGHPVVEVGGAEATGAVSAAPWGSPSILPISWAYIRMMGAEGLTRATKVAILNANYMAHRLEEHFPVLYRGRNGTVAHECIVDLRHFRQSAGIEVEDVAKRLMDYGFHAPTVSFPVAGTLMIEPTESESKEELDRFCEAMIQIREEIREIERGEADRADNVLKNAPHTMGAVITDDWSHPYAREKAAFPTEWTRDRKFWPHVGRVEGAWGDRNLVCACPSVEVYEEIEAGV
jgi:glycine dehydrogenase